MRLMLAMVLAWGLAGFASGDFVMDSGYPSGGSIPSGTGGFSNSGNTRSGSSGGTPSSITGPINFSWTWTGSQPLPSYVILKVTVAAGWGGYGGTSDDGLGDTEVTNGGNPYPPPTDGSSSGTHYVLQSVSGSTVTYSVDPVALCSSGGCDVSASVTVTPVSLSLLGPVGSRNSLAVGQLLKATVTGMGGPSDTYTWSAPSAGNPFAGYSPSTSSCAAPAAFAVPGTSSTSLSCYFGKPQSVTISCTYHSAAANLDVPLSATVVVVGPTITLVTHTIGGMHLTTGGYDWFIGSPYPDSFVLWDAMYNLETWGMFLVDEVQDPNFVALSGEWGYVQTKDRTSTFNGTVTHVTGLDGDFPHHDVSGWGYAWTPADNSSRVLQDSPGLIPLPSTSFTLSFAGDYYDYIFYKAPDDDAGSSVFVPVEYIPWNALGSCSLVAPSTWSGSDSGSGFASGSTTYPALSAWPTW